ncbi:MAG: DNA-directed RNA polymerase subunit D, partial [Candidatus Bathyarchaeota archaeon]|nr:DNA-directed RNA polymerase subunit D [Candidatus Bathyarchaeota archaeon]
VYSKDLKFEDPNIYPVSDKIPIVKLEAGQKLKLEVYARLGLGKHHAKWQPVSVCAYKNMPVINIDSAKCDSCGVCVEVCPKNVLGLENGKLKVLNLLLCNLCCECVEVCPKNPPALEVTWKEGEFIFTVESTGCLPVKEVLLKAGEILKNKAIELSRQLKSLR